MKKLLSMCLVFIMLLSVISGLNFSSFAATKISTITIKDVDTPLPGRSLDLDADKVEATYTFDTINGSNYMSWYDLSVSSVKSIPSSSKYTEGHRYMVTIRLVTLGGYEFDDITKINATEYKVKTNLICGTKVDNITEKITRNTI